MAGVGYFWLIAGIGELGRIGVEIGKWQNKNEQKIVNLLHLNKLKYLVPSKTKIAPSVLQARMTQCVYI